MRAPAIIGATALILGGAVVAAGTSAAAPASPGLSTKSVSRTSQVVDAAEAALRAHPRASRLGAHQAFRATDALVDSDGATHVRFTRTYRGLPVLGGDLVVHRAGSGAFEGVSQTLRTTPDLTATPKVGQRAAERTALAPRTATSGITGAEVGSHRLVYDATSGTPRLVWEVVTGGTQADGTPSRLATYVDARTGAALRSEQQIETVDGSGQSLYSGTVPLQLTLANGTYQLKDPTRGNTYTTDMGNKSDSYACQIFGVNCATGT